MIKLQQALQAKMKEFGNLQKVQRHLAQLEGRIGKERQQMEHILEQVSKENQDMENLEKLSIKSLFHKILGNQEQQMEKERQEYLQAALKYEELHKSLELHEFEREILAAKASKAHELEYEINQLIEEKKKQLIENHPETGKKIIQLTFSIDRHQKIIGEMQEAIGVGVQTLGLLDQMIRLLQGAKDWGTWDLIDKRRMSSYLKHSKIDEARSLSFQVKQQLMKFEDELDDVYRIERNQFDFSLNFNAFTSFTDLFMDNLISDWIVQRKIANALATVQSMHDKVLRTISFLKADIPKQEQEIKRLEKLKTQFIIEA